MIASYNAAISAIPMPDRIRHLPVSDTGFPIPWFVATIDGVPDFRIIKPGSPQNAFRRSICWVCGETLGKIKAVPMGPMCAIARCISEPPLHRECAFYSVQACPFLMNPRMRRHEAGLPEDRTLAPGAIMRNPGAVGIWLTRGVWPMRDGLFTFDDPEEVHWFREGRTATREEVQASIDSGFHILKAKAEEEGKTATDIEEMVALAQTYLPQPGTNAPYLARAQAR
jgi:hypothetical protein